MKTSLCGCLCCAAVIHVQIALVGSLLGRAGSFDAYVMMSARDGPSRGKEQKGETQYTQYTQYTHTVRALKGLPSYTMYYMLSADGYIPARVVDGTHLEKTGKTGAAACECNSHRIRNHDFPISYQGLFFSVSLLFDYKTSNATVCTTLQSDYQTGQFRLVISVASNKLVGFQQLPAYTFSTETLLDITRSIQLKTFIWKIPLDKTGSDFDLIFFLSIHFRLVDDAISSNPSAAACTQVYIDAV